MLSSDEGEAGGDPSASFLVLLLRLARAPDRCVRYLQSTLSTHVTKETAVAAGQKVAKANQPSQLVVHKMDGTIEHEYTYGNDPYPPRG